jgi:hypothetical protein
VVGPFALRSMKDGRVSTNSSRITTQMAQGIPSALPKRGSRFCSPALFLEAWFLVLVPSGLPIVPI